MAMRQRLLAAVLAAAACAPVPEAAVHLPARAELPYVRPHSLAEVHAQPEAPKDAVAPRGLPALDPGLVPISSRVRPKAPQGVRCAVYGGGSGLVRSCGMGQVNVAETRGGGTTSAVVQLYGAEYAWGFFSGRKKAWFHAQDGSFSVEGYANARDARFAVRREVASAADDVWLKQGAAVVALGADDDGVAIALDDPFPGIDEVPLHVPCEALIFDSVEPPTPETLPGSSPMVVREEPEIVFSANEQLVLYQKPGEPAFARLGGQERPFDVALTVRERAGEFTRVAFETESARFVLWTRQGDLADFPVLGSFGISICCGGVGVGRISSRPLSALETTRVVIGKTPAAGQTSRAVSILEGAEVDVDEERGGFAAVTPRRRSAIQPPEGSRFWVPLEVLGHRTETAGER